LKIKILDKDGKEALINPENIKLGDITLQQFLDEFIELQNKVRKTFTELELREKTLKEVVKKL
jgi:hypothetical protein